MFRELIYAYSRAEAVAECEQFDISGLALGAGFKFPVFLTSRVSNIIEESLIYGANSYEGVIWDILMVLKYQIKIEKAANLITFKVVINWQNEQNKTFDLLAECAPLDIDDPRPAITIMLPAES